jgi:hypothetical protein
MFLIALFDENFPSSGEESVTDLFPPFELNIGIRSESAVAERSCYKINDTLWAIDIKRPITYNKGIY